MSARIIRPGLSPIGDFLADALLDLEDDTGGETFRWKDTVDIPCTSSTLSAGLTLEYGGFEIPIVHTLMARREEFLEADSELVTVDSDQFTADDDRPSPVTGKTIVFRGRTLRIIRVREAPGRGHYSIDLAEINSTR